jgi:hypothetical protein
MRTAGPPPAAGCPPSLTRFPKRPKARKAAFRPSAVSLAYITGSGGGWRGSREPESYLRRVSGECPASVRRDSHHSPRRPASVWLVQLRLQRRVQIWDTFPPHNPKCRLPGYPLRCQQWIRREVCPTGALAGWWLETPKPATIRTCLTPGSSASAAAMRPPACMGLIGRLRKVKKRAPSGKTPRQGFCMNQRNTS